MSSLLLAFLLAVAAPGKAAAPALPRLATPPEDADASALLQFSMQAMGGEVRLRAVSSTRLKGIGHTLLVEQSERPEGPYAINYQQFVETRDFKGVRMVRGARQLGAQFPEWTDGRQVTLLGEGAGQGFLSMGGRTMPVRPAALEEAKGSLALGPERVLLTASQAAELKREKDTVLQGVPHHVLSFKWDGYPVTLFLNANTALPTAVEVLRPFKDFWSYWGDVRARTWYGEWQLADGLLFPTNWSEERNGQLFRTRVITAWFVNPELDEADFSASDAEMIAAKGGPAAPGQGASTELADGIAFFPGPWNLAVVRQPDGLVVLEAPNAEPVVQGSVEEARKRYAGAQVKAVISTSDAWPHHGGVRSCVARGWPVYALELNVPLLERIVAAPRTLRPDSLSQKPRKPEWRVVKGKTVVGEGPNRMELYPLRGESTERQLMVYFPERKLLYASDTLAMLPDGTLLNPQLVNEVRAAVEREGLQVETVFAMHAGPTPWMQVLERLSKFTGR